MFWGVWTRNLFLSTSGNTLPWPIHSSHWVAPLSPLPLPLTQLPLSLLLLPLFSLLPLPPVPPPPFLPLLPLSEVVYARATPSYTGRWGEGIFKINVNIVIIMCSHHPIYYHLMFSLLVNQHKNLLMYKKLFLWGRVKYLKAGARLIFFIDSQLKVYR